jgi:hypothetical protein
MTSTNPQQYISDLGGFQNQIGSKVDAYKNKQDLVNSTVGKLKSKALQKAQDVMKQGQNLVNTAYESQGGAAAVKLLGKGGTKAASWAKGKVQEKLAQRQGVANNQAKGMEEEKGTEMEELPSENVAEGERGSMPKSTTVGMDEDFAGYAKEDGGGEEKGEAEPETPGAGETEGGNAEAKVESETNDDVPSGSNTTDEIADLGVGDEVLDDAAAATSWIPIIGEILAGAAAVAGIGVGVAGLVDEAKGGAAEKKAEAMPTTASQPVAPVNVAGTYVVAAKSSLSV